MGRIWRNRVQRSKMKNAMIQDYKCALKKYVILLSWGLVGLMSPPLQAQEGGGDQLPRNERAELLDIFRADGDRLITLPEHLGIVNDMASVGIAHDYVGVIDGLWAPPYVASDFFLEPRLFGERVKTDHYTWLPYQTNRVGMINGIRLTTASTLIFGMRAGVLSMTLENTTKDVQDIPIQIIANGPDTYRVTLDYRDKKNDWGFGTTRSSTPVETVVDEKGISRVQSKYAVAIAGNVDGLVWQQATRRFHANLNLSAGGKITMHIVFAVGEIGNALAERNSILANPDQYIQDATEHYIYEVRDIFAKLPSLHSDNKALEQLYNRSLSILVLNKFQIPEFALHPYYATGSIKGGCYKDYLWNYAAVSEILPLVDPEADKKHILQFIRSGGLYNGHSFDPITGEGTGSWYPVNQNLIIKLIYDYVKNTGDVAFLDVEVAAGETVLDHAVRNALHLSDRSKPEKLVDYGPRGDHLELRREFTYNHIMPDLNGLRYKNYERVSELCALAGDRQPDLMRRAREIKKLLKEQLWSPTEKWFAYADEKGNKEMRYTIQMFYLLNSDVIDEEIERGLLSHLNESEFFSEYGFHSMSKKDVAYDQVDIDNGGGGSCTLFPPQIAQLLYDAGKPEIADDIMRRILWWGERLPYFGDSQVANEIDYRRDTPLQADIGTISVATTILFGMAGITPELDGSISINPTSRLLGNFEIKGLNLLGKTIDISRRGDEFQVRCNGKRHTSKVGRPVEL